MNKMAIERIGDKMLQSVLLDQNLMEYGHYTANDCTSLVKALSSDNYIVKAVAQIIDRGREGSSSNEIYREVSDYLKQMV